MHDSELGAVSCEPHVISRECVRKLTSLILENRIVTNSSSIFQNLRNIISNIN